MTDEIIIECKKCKKFTAKVLDYTNPNNLSEHSPDACFYLYCPDCKLFGVAILNPFEVRARGGLKQ